jgi:60 kDa SS-A/Ro ribonucleoprotein
MVVRNHLAMLRNLRNITEAGVSPAHIKKLRKALRHPSWATAMTLPHNFMAAAKACPQFEREIEAAMLASLSSVNKLPGHTVLVVDVSGSMNAKISGKSEMTRLDAAAALAMLASEVCESVTIYVTAGNDGARKHATERITPRRGFDLAQDITSARTRVSGGGIFTRQMLEYVRTQEREDPARIIVFSDSQDCDHAELRVPKPFGRANYIVDVSANTHGVNYAGVWTAEVSGWSEHFLSYIAALEGVSIPVEDDSSLQG